jgi:predicted Rossmann fold flavoprotein
MATDPDPCSDRPRADTIAEPDVLVLGAGAAGLFCAVEAGRRGRRVVVLERNGGIGHKIRISGGGRCNFTNLHASPEQYVSGNPDFCRSALARFTPADIVALVEKHRIPYYEKKLGQLFCRDSAERFIEMLRTECARTGVRIEAGCAVAQVEGAGPFVVRTPRGAYRARALVVATGGLSIPKMGATDFGHRLARQYGLRVTELRPALVPLTFGAEDGRRFADLAGIAFDARSSCNGVSFHENALFTHRGLSGPAVLQISSYWNPREPVTIDLLPGVDLRSWLAEKRRLGLRNEPAGLLPELLPQRLARRWCELYLPAKPIARYTDAELDRAAEAFHRWTFVPAGTEGYKKAEVTRGGVDTRELSPQTMESRRVPGLYFIGEVVDVTGWLGGYNFQWAWASAYAAGKAV